MLPAPPPPPPQIGPPHDDSVVKQSATTGNATILTRVVYSPPGAGLLCIVLVVGPNLVLPDLAASLDAPTTAMHGAARKVAEDWLTVRCALSTILLIVIAIAHLRSPRTRCLAWIPAAAMLVGFVVLYLGHQRIESVPIFRARVAESLPAIDSLAVRVRGGESPETPCRAGHFEIVAVERLGRAVVLYTHLSDGYPPAGRWGFVHIPGAISDRCSAADVGFEGEIGEQNLVERISGDWFVLANTYWYIKRGWS